MSGMVLVSKKSRPGLPDASGSAAKKSSPVAGAVGLLSDSECDTLPEMLTGGYAY